MEENIGKTDKNIRMILALVFAYLGYAYTPWLYIVAVILVVTIATGSCLPYKLLGISTNKKK
ncbi:DUF2892 domain-containing protein [Candidatus Woesearchaeota archaeon]|nr:DUF2892 domain-containing protein [Candidatus Woesearchaeota archaeon]